VKGEDAMNPISREEFTAFTTRLYETIDDGFAGTHRRLDAQNGRIGKTEIELVRQGERLNTLEESHVHRRASDPVPAEPSMTPREKTLAIGGLALLTAVVKLGLLVGEFAIQFMKAAVHK
jgi:hypothetical protein